MKIWAFLLALSAMVAGIAPAAEVMPDELVGEWVTSKTEFTGVTLAKGQVVYIGKDGVGVVIGGPPPIGFKILITYDSVSHLVAVTAVEGKNSKFLGSFVYDPLAHTLTDPKTPGESGTYRRRTDQIPNYVLKDLQRVE